MPPRVWVALVLGVLCGFLVERWNLVPSKPEGTVTTPPAPPQELVQSMPEKEVRAQVRLQPIVERPKRPTPPRPSSREEVPMPVFQEVAPSPQLLGRGQALLTEGRFPGLTAHYRSTIGFAGYADGIRRLGGRLFVRDLQARQLRAEIDLTGNRLQPVEAGSLSQLSPRSRDLSEEPALQPFVRVAQETFGGGPYGVVVLVPIAVDRFVLAGIEQTLQRRGFTPEGFVNFEGRYQRRGQDIVLEILSGWNVEGEAVPLPMALNLSGVARGEGS